MDLTIKEIADTLGVSKNTVKYHMRKLNDVLSANDYLYKNSGMIYVREDGIKLIEASIVALHSETKEPGQSNEEKEAIETTKTALLTPSQDNNSENELPVEIAFLLKERDERLKLLVSQIDHLESNKANTAEQLQIKDEQIAELHKLLNQQQQLNLIAEAKIKELESTPKALEGTTQEEVESLKTWWQFWKQVPLEYRRVYPSFFLPL